MDPAYELRDVGIKVKGQQILELFDFEHPALVCEHQNTENRPVLEILHIVLGYTKVEN